MSTLVAATLKTPYQYAQELKTVLIEVLGETEAGWDDARSYVDWGRPMLIPGCDQLVISGMGFGQSNTVAPPSGAGVRDIHGAVNLVSFTITIARDCAPTFDGKGNPPAEDAISASAEEVFDSVWGIWTRLYQRKRDKSLFEGKCRELYFDGATALETEGTLKGAEIAIRAEIYGIIASGP